MYEYALINSSQIVILSRLLLAAFLGALVGYDREKTGHPAGLRTHIIVCVTSAFLITASLNFMNVDAIARIGAAIITGIGFLGAGTILVHGEKIVGLTTAATVFGMAGIGIIVGMGIYFEAIIATVIFLIVLNLRSFEPNKQKYEKNKKR
jgi:putative Mg2+ transporter-C (MgtC) family protein